MSNQERQLKVKRLKLLKQKARRKMFSIEHLSPRQKEIIVEDNTYTLIEGGNGASKSFTAAKKFQLALYNNNPYHRYDFTGKKAWVMSVSRETCHNVLWLEKLKYLLPEEDIEHIAKDGKFISRITLKNGWTIDFMSYLKGRGAVQAASVDLIWIDELPPYDVFKEVQQRMRHKDRCRMILSFTPLEDDAEMKAWCQMTPGRLGEENDANITSKFRLTKYDNPTLKYELIEQERRGMSESEWEVRGLGMWATKGNVVFGEALTTENIVSPFEIPSNWRRIASADPATSSFCGVLWFAEDPDSGDWYAYREALITGLAPSELVLDIMRLTQREKLWDLILDTHETWFIKEYRNINPDQPISLPQKVNNKENFIAMFKEDLISRKVKIFNTLENTLHQIRTYQRDAKGRIVKKNDHLVDCGLYFSACRPQSKRAVQQNVTFTSKLWEAIKKKTNPEKSNDYGEMF